MSMTLPVVTPPSIAIAGSAERFPVRRIFCVGRNYADHAREMGHDPDREPPFFFTKPADAVCAGGALPFPSHTADLHHEVELVVALGEGLAVFGCAVGLDLTRRDLQAEAKKLGRPWDMAKGFDRSAPIGPLRVGPLPSASAAISLTIDGKTRQSGHLADMIWSVPEIIATIAGYVTLMPGDLIFTGTPAGVGPIRPGESVVGTIDGLDPIELRFD
ncbi:fumarylacetoacetate hydrolase family protein [Sphingomonas abietis]|uniref:Fumarylacetoacetate hydrolase family protein n=1 Tax=Sphingomonas abietis TaxID=3012344 RepID=A0ABY7NNU4_9SPHN|nr:fumarylacetoacetate hydrolase family protein [Sphingomonas abietis]WBO21584.1 fumarylacetoacetate hydrolase family protein [Sphingomonas abietis]